MLPQAMSAAHANGASTLLHAAPRDKLDGCIRTLVLWSARFSSAHYRPDFTPRERRVPEENRACLSAGSPKRKDQGSLTTGKPVKKREPAEHGGRVGGGRNHSRDASRQRNAGARCAIFAYQGVASFTNIFQTSTPSSRVYRISRSWFLQRSALSGSSCRRVIPVTVSVSASML